VNNFADVYRIASSAPTTSLDIGDLYFDTTANELKVYKSSGWAAAGSTVNGTSARFHYDISGTPTSVTGADANGSTLAYDAGYVDVYVNGVRMSQADVTVTSGDTVTFTEALADGDEVDIVAYGTFSVATLDASNLSSGTVPDARITGAYTGITNLTMSGDLTVDTSTLYVDSANNNVGINTLTPNTTNLNSGTTSGIVVKSGGVAKNNFVALPSTGGSQWDVRESGGSGGEFSMRMFDTSGAHNVQISSNGDHFFNGGNIGIGTSSPSNKLEVHSGDATNVVAKSTNGNGGYLNYSGLSSGGTTTFSVTHNGRVYAGDGILLGGTGSANLLDDYEEGTWTPAYQGDITAGTYTLGEAQGTYTKIGNMVIAHVNITNISTVSAGSGNVQITGLPFSVGGNPSGFNTEQFGNVYCNLHAIGTSQQVVILYTNSFKIFKASGSSTLINVNVTSKSSNSADVRGFIIYRTA
jgi:hypothetical protein